MPKIEIVGTKGLHEKTAVKDEIIQLGGKYYWKTDRDNLVKVPRFEGGKEAGWRLFRKNSTLIVKTGYETYQERVNCVCTVDGIWMLKIDAVKINNDYYRKEYCVRIDNNWYLKTDPSIVKCISTQKFIHKQDAIELDKAQYGDNRYVSKKNKGAVVEVQNGKLFLIQDTFKILNRDGQEIYYDRRDPTIARASLIDVFFKWREPTNPDPERIVFISAFEKDSDVFPRSQGLGIRVHVNRIREIENEYAAYVELKLRKDIEAVRSTMNKNYYEAGDDENQAKTISLKYHTFPGKHPIFVCKKPAIDISRTTGLTGGIGYTFGVEIETSAGMVPDSLCQELLIDKMGDRSIGSAEYVTMPLHGDKGVKNLEAIFKAISEQTFVDNRCGLHIHVGGHEKATTPGFGRTFNINAIRLGCQLEADLYKISPKSRYPEMKHCHSIMRFNAIRANNWKKYLGAYLFGPRENWNDPYNLDYYVFGEDGRTADQNVGTWAGSRYKWLNLIHCATRSKIKTIEFRLFAGTTNHQKAYNYLLISLAFVWFVDNKQSLIDKGDVSLETVIKEAYKGKHLPLQTQVLSFIAERKKRFNRTTKSLYRNYPFNNLIYTI